MCDSCPDCPECGQTVAEPATARYLGGMLGVVALAGIGLVYAHNAGIVSSRFFHVAAGALVMGTWVELQMDKHVRAVFNEPIKNE